MKISNINGKVLSTSLILVLTFTSLTGCHSYKENEDKTSADLDLPDGAYVSIEDGNVIFTPYQGKPSLGFKKSGSSKSDTSPTEPSDESAEATSTSTDYSFDD